MIILAPKKKPEKRFEAKWKTIGGARKYYRSKWEANYACYLEFLKENRAIRHWQHECKTFWFEGIKRGVVSYLPDFLVVSNDDTEEYHEVKGWMDPKSATKLKRMKKYHPNVKVKVIDSKWFKANKHLSKIVKQWE